MRKSIIAISVLLFMVFTGCNETKKNSENKQIKKESKLLKDLIDQGKKKNSINQRLKGKV